MITWTEAVVQMCSIKKVFLEISQNSQENACARVSFLVKLQAWRLQLYLKKRLRYRGFPVNFVKFLRTPFYIEHLWWLLLDRPTQAYKHVMIGPAMCCKQNYRITLLKGLITDNKNLLRYSSLQSCFSKTTAVDSIIADQI